MNDYPSISASPSSTSYFSEPESNLDPKLFSGEHLKSWVRTEVLNILFENLAPKYVSPHSWVSAWLAGSGVSYQWSSQRDPGDLDCLVGINYGVFRRFNPDYSGLTNAEIASMFNEEFHEEIMPNTSNWEGYELTYYVNQQSNIVDINPYAAYDLVHDSWTVKPQKDQRPPHSKQWQQNVDRDYSRGLELIDRYGSALKEYRGAQNSPNLISARRKLDLAVDQAVDMYDELHKGRKIAFSTTGSGYADFHNYRWQAGKRSGIVPALRRLKEYKAEYEKAENIKKYGVELPSTDTLILRAALHKVYKG